MNCYPIYMQLRPVFFHGNIDSLGDRVADPFDHRIDILSGHIHIVQFCKSHAVLSHIFDRIELLFPAHQLLQCISHNRGGIHHRGDPDGNYRYAQGLFGQGFAVIATPEPG